MKLNRFKYNVSSKIRLFIILIILISFFIFLVSIQNINFEQKSLSEIFNLNENAYTGNAILEGEAEYSKTDADINSPVFTSVYPENNTIVYVNNVSLNVTTFDENNHSLIVNWNNSLVSWWRMDDLNASNDSMDYLGINNGSALNGAVYNTSGKFNGSFSFNGSSSIEIKDSNSLDFSDEITISAWINPYFIVNEAIFGKTNAYQLRLVKSGSTLQLRGVVYADEVYNDITATGATKAITNLDTWYHVGMTYKNNSFNLYINGTKVVNITTLTGAIAVNTQKVNIGSLGASTYFNGSIDNIMVFNRALDSEEIASIYNASIYSHIFTSISDGNHSYKLYAEDIYGNLNESSYNFQVIDDVTTPLVSIIYPDNLTYIVNVSTLNYTVSDLNLQACWYSLNNGALNTTFSCGNNLTGLSSNEGNNVWWIGANDSAGNKNSESVTFYKDTIFPNFTNLVNFSIYNNQSISYDINADDASGVNCFNVNDTSHFEISCTGLLRNISLLSVGTYYLNISANDELNNLYTAVIYVIVNQSASPVIPSGTTGTTGSTGGSTSTSVVGTSLSGFLISPDIIKTSLKQGETKRETINVTNTGSNDITINAEIQNLGKFAILDYESFLLKSGETKVLNLDIYAKESEIADAYLGRIIFTGDSLNKTINLIIEIKEKKPLFDLKIDIKDKYVPRDGKVKAGINLLNLGDINKIDVVLYYAIKDFNGKIYTSKDESIAIVDKLDIIREVEIPKDIELGKYTLYVKTSYGNITATSADDFNVVEEANLLTYILYGVISILILLLMIMSYLTLRALKE